MEKFGARNAAGGFNPFHFYSMKQAIEEEFILGMLTNHTTCKSYYEVWKSIEDNPQFDTVKAQKKLRAYVESHQQTIDTNRDIALRDLISKAVGKERKRDLVPYRSYAGDANFRKSLE